MNVVRLDTRIEMWVSHEAVTDVFYSMRKNLAISVYHQFRAVHVSRFLFFDVVFPNFASGTISPLGVPRKRPFH